MLTTVAFPRHANEPATIAPHSIGKVYKHYGLIATARETIRALEPPGTHGDERHGKTWVDL